MSRTRNPLLCILLGLALAFVPACSDDDPAGPGNNGTPYRLDATLDNAVVDVPLTADQPTTVNLTLNLPPDIPLVAAATIDVAGTLDHVTVDGVALWTLIARRAASILGKADDLGATATIRVGSDPGTACASEVVYGPFTVTQGTSLTVEPATVAADGTTLDIINTGSMTICLTITPNFDGLLGVDAVAMDIAEGDCPAPADFSGTWAGSYQCGNGCGAPFGGPIELTVTQNGTNATYTDSNGDTFTGVVCGDMLRFEHTGTDFVERGTLRLDGPDAATKRSTWRGVEPPYCGGDCVDVLTRVSGGGGGGGDCPGLELTSGPPPDGTVGTPYFFQATTSGGAGTVTRWAIPEEPIPGLEYGENGILSGTPQAGAVGTWTVNVTVYDQCEPEAQVVNRSYAITIGG